MLVALPSDEIVLKQASGIYPAPVRRIHPSTCDIDPLTNDGTMSTLADELLQDFEDSGSENGDVRDNAGLELDDGPALSNGHPRDGGGDMMLDGDEEDDNDGNDDDREEEPDEDENMGGVGVDDGIVNAMEDEEAAKARVEKMHLGHVKDVRKVTSVMDRLEPLLKVSR